MTACSMARLESLRSKTCTTDFIAGYATIPVLLAMDPASGASFGLLKRPVALLLVLISNPE